MLDEQYRPLPVYEFDQREYGEWRSEMVWDLHWKRDGEGWKVFG